MDRLRSCALLWALAALLSSAPPTHGAVQRLDVQPSLTSQAINSLLDLSRTVCKQDPNLAGCSATDFSLEADSSDFSRVQLTTTNDMGVLASLFTLHISHINEEHDKLVIAKDKLQRENEDLHNRLKAMETLYLQQTAGNVTDEENAVMSDTFNDLASGQRSTRYSPNALFLRPVDCADHLLLGATKSGVYEIFPFRCRCSQPVRVWCDMETDGGGWTVFFGRQNGTVRQDFNRSWAEFSQGFGDPANEFFMGTEHLHTLTADRQYILRVDLELPDGSKKFSEWHQFSIMDERNKYKMQVGQFQPYSMTTDCLTGHMNNQFFSTVDYDNDRTNNNCALSYLSGWWYNNCGIFTPGYALPNGLLETHCPYVVNGKKINIAATKVHMKIRPKICGRGVTSAYFNSHTCADYNRLRL